VVVDSERCRAADHSSVCVFALWQRQGTTNPRPGQAGQKLPVRFRPEAALSHCIVGVSLHPSPSVRNVSPEIIEMQTCGFPVLTIRSGCVANFVEDGKCGFIFANEQMLKDRLVRIMTGTDHCMQGVSRQPRDFEEEWRAA
jgi:hypothetical protein